MFNFILDGKPEKIKRETLTKDYDKGGLKMIDLKTFEPRHEKTCPREFPTRSDSNWPAQLQKLAGGLKFWLQKLEILHYLGSEQQRRWSDCADAQADLRLCCSHMA